MPTMPPSSCSLLPGALCAAAVAAVTGLVFSPATGNGFVNWDDVAMVVENNGYRAPGWQAIRYAFTSTFFSHYHPLTWLSFALDARLWGVSAAGFHLTNVLLHSLGAGLAFLMMRQLLAIARGEGGIVTDVAALVGALSFALHPLRVEAVAWVTARRDVLCGVFVTLTLLAYVRAASVRSGGEDTSEPRRHGDTRPIRTARGWLTVALVFYAAALLSKTISMTLPLLLVILDWYPLRRWAWREKLPFLALGGTGAAIAAWAVATSTGFTSLSAYDVPQRLAMAAYSLSYYVAKTIWPVGLTPLRELPAHVNPLSPVFLGSLVAVAAVAVLAVTLRRRAPSATAAWAAYVALVLPVSGLTHAGAQLVYDRYSYLPGLVGGLLLGGAVAAAVTAWRRARLRPPFLLALMVVTLCVLVGWSHLSRGQIGIWRSSETLWRAALVADPTCAICHSGLGVTLADLGRLEDAERELRIAILLRPGYSQAWLNLGSVLFDLGVVRATAGQNEEALRYFTEAAALLPDHPGVARRLADARAAARRGTP